VGHRRDEFREEGHPFLTFCLLPDPQLAKLFHFG